MKPVDRAEVRKSVFQLGALKAPEPDGMYGIFYQQCWDIVGNDLTNAVIISFFENGRMPKELNHTNIILIPKVPHPKSIYQFRSIGLCNFHYKVIARIITNRMKNIMGHVVDES